VGCISWEIYHLWEVYHGMFIPWEYIREVYLSVEIILTGISIVEDVSWEGYHRMDIMLIILLVG